MRNNIFVVFVFFLVMFFHTAFASPYFQNTVEDQDNASSFLRDRTKFHDYIANNSFLNKALFFLKNGQCFYFKQGDVYETTNNSEKSSEVIFNYIKNTKSVIVFSSHFSPNANAYFQQGKQVVVGKWFDKATNKEKDITSFHENVIWISDRYKNSPAIIAMLIAHEVGHGLYREYKFNKNSFPGEPGDVENQNESCDELLSEKSIEEYIAYAREGAIAAELHFPYIFDNIVDTQFYEALTPKAKEKFRELFGDIEPRSFEQLKLEIRYVSDVRRCFRGYSAKKRKCGMPCKYFGEYKLCDNPVVFPPCRLWAKHIESLKP